MSLVTVTKRALALLPLVVIGAGLALPSTAGASGPGPVQIPLKNPGPGSCPAGTDVVVSPGRNRVPTSSSSTPGRSTARRASTC